MIRPAQPDDVPVLLRLTEQTGLFLPHEIDTLSELLTDYFAGLEQWQHRAHVLQRGNQAGGFVYYAPASLTDRTWYLYWIVVARELQGQGWGSQLLRFVEDDLRQRGARLLLIETSSRPAYAPTRAFYQKRGYVPCATVPDFYADGDDLIIFIRRL